MSAWKNKGGLGLAGLLAISSGWNMFAAERPIIQDLQLENGQLTLQVDVPEGFGHVLVESGNNLLDGLQHPLVSGRTFGNQGTATISIPEPNQTMFFVIQAGLEAEPPLATFSGGNHFRFDSSNMGGGPLSPAEASHHALSRLSYGPSPLDAAYIEEHGLDTFIERQLHPEQIDDSGNVYLREANDDLFYDFPVGDDQYLIQDGDKWFLKKGDVAPPFEWNLPDYDYTQDDGWRIVPSGMGYSNSGREREMIRTQLNDMRRIEEGDNARPGYISFFIRRPFDIEDPEQIDGLWLKMIYDDGFIAYLNGTEIARDNMGTTKRPSYRAKADSARGDPDAGFFDVTRHKSLLVAGENWLAIELHNTEFTSSDAVLVPMLIHRKYLPGFHHERIRNIDSLQKLIHARGIYSEKQLQAVMGEFWENHFTTDYDKTFDYLDDLEDSRARDAMFTFQAELEASQVEYKEYQFFYDHAFDAFGDLLLYSATSPSMLIYLDNVLNRVGEANENYAREILELFAFGVDNRYTQRDIEELSRCFTGWQIRKVRPDRVPAFPESALQPPIEPTFGTFDVPIVDLGSGWRYFKGTKEPVRFRQTVSPEWASSDFNDTSWAEGATGIGYGDGDDATTLSDMRNNYLSVYLRRSFVLPQDADSGSLILSVDYDDGFVAYINGREVARSDNMQGAGVPPRFNARPNQGHEARGEPDEFNLARFDQILKPWPEVNTLAIQVHNLNMSSSDLSILPRLVSRSLSDGSIEPGDPNGEWTFRFNPDDHDYGAKVVFEGTEWETRIPEGRTGIEGLHDALDIVRMMADHPSTREFICVKLVNKFVSDEISLRTYKDGSAPSHLIAIVDRAIQAWQQAEPVGHIGTVLTSIFDRSEAGNPFWTQSVYQAKVKTPVEYINSLGRAMGWSVDLDDMPELNEEMGMHLFTRDDPDGWSEFGFDWINTGAMLERLNFATQFAGYRNNPYLRRWTLRRFLNHYGLESEIDILDHFDKLLFNDELSEETRDLIIDFVRTMEDGSKVRLDPRRSDYQQRAGELIGMILAVPEMHYQ